MTDKLPVTGTFPLTFKHNLLPLLEEDLAQVKAQFPGMSIDVHVTLNEELQLVVEIGPKPAEPKEVM